MTGPERGLPGCSLGCVVKTAEKGLGAEGCGQGVGGGGESSSA